MVLGIGLSMWERSFCHLFWRPEVCHAPPEPSVRLVKEGRVGAVKIEGGARVLPHIRAIVDAGVAVMGHLGLTPQSYTALGGFCVQGRSAEAAHALLEEAKLLEAAGCFGLVLEMVPEPVAREITRQVRARVS